MQIPTDHKLYTARCILRHSSLSEAERFLSAFASDDFPRYVPLGQFTSIEQVLTWIEGSQLRWRTGQGYTWTAERKADRTVVGQASVVQIEPDGTWSLAFWIHPDSWGNGYATEIAQAVVDFAFKELSAARVWAAAGIWNQGSLRVLRKLGMSYLGDHPAGYQINNEPIPTQEFALERSNWKELQGG